MKPWNARLKVGLLVVIGALAVALLSVAIRPSENRSASRIRGATKSEPTETTAAAQQQTTMLAREVHDLRSQLARLTNDVASIAGPEGGIQGTERWVGSGLDQDHFDETSALSPQDRDALMIAESFGRYDELMASEGHDGRSAMDHEDRIHNSVRLRSDATVTEARCTKTLCRVVLEHATVDDRRSFCKDAVGSAPFNTNCFFTPADEGIGTVLYCSRPGFKLPRPPEEDGRRRSASRD